MTPIPAPWVPSHLSYFENENRNMIYRLLQEKYPARGSYQYGRIVLYPGSGRAGAPAVRDSKLGSI